MQGSKADADTENRLVDTVWEGEGGTNGESSMETHTLPYVKQDSQGNSLYDSQSSNWGSVTTWRGGQGGRWEGVQEGGDTRTPVTDPC